jgi:hypothetical protein
VFGFTFIIPHYSFVRISRNLVLISRQLKYKPNQTEKETAETMAIPQTTRVGGREVR